MTIPFLETKFHIPPVRPEYVFRPRLVEQLNRNLHRKLTLVSAPAGFGKTSLISEWILGTNRQTAWLSLDKRDNDPLRFLSYLTGALQKTGDNIGSRALNMIQSAEQTPSEPVLTSLINEIASQSREIILVIDDYHIIDDREIDEILNFLIDNLPSQMHLVLSTREDPQLGLSRLRASGQMNELRALELRFLRNEIAQFMNDRMKLQLNPEDIASLEQRTEGWIASLQLAALSIQKQQDIPGFIKSFTGSNRLVLDYLVEEVLRNQNGEIQEFLIKTSILERMCGSLCNEITGREDSQKILETLENSNLFIIPLDDERRWFRYHHLFAELLRHRLRETQNDNIPELHKKAGFWFSQNHYDFEAIEHNLLARDFENAVGWIEAYLRENFEKITQATRKRWLESIPEEYLGTRPYLALFEAWSMIVAGQLEIAERCIGAVENSPVPRGSSNQENRLQWTQCLAMAAVFRSFIQSYRGNFDASIRQGLRALDYHRELISQHGPAAGEGEIMRPRTFALIVLAYAYDIAGLMDEAEQARRDAVSAAKLLNDRELIGFAGVLHAESLKSKGNLREAAKICQNLLYDPENLDISENPKFCWLFAFYSDVLTEMGETDSALEQVELALERASRCEDGFYIIRSCIYIVRTFISWGESERAWQAINQVERLALQRSLPLPKLLILQSWKARLLLAQGKIDEAVQWAENLRIDTGTPPLRIHEEEYLAFARIRIAQGFPEEAILLLEWAETLAVSENRTAAIIESFIIQSMAFLMLDNLNSALKILEKALSLAEPLDFIGIFIDEGSSMSRLLYEAAKAGIRTAYVRLLLDHFPSNKPEVKTMAKIEAKQNGLMEPLSDREIDVLQLIAEGMSNEQLGEKLFISVHTVKVHTRNIYAKLECHNRTEAVAQARKFGIL